LAGPVNKSLDLIPQNIKQKKGGQDSTPLSTSLFDSFGDEVLIYS